MPRETGLVRPTWTGLVTTTLRLPLLALGLEVMWHMAKREPGPYENFRPFLPLDLRARGDLHPLPPGFRGIYTGPGPRAQMRSTEHVRAGFRAR